MTQGRHVKIDIKRELATIKRDREILRNKVNPVRQNIKWESVHHIACQIQNNSLTGLQYTGQHSCIENHPSVLI